MTNYFKSLSYGKQNIRSIAGDIIGWRMISIR